LELLLKLGHQAWACSLLGDALSVLEKGFS
jgi:hypothetical protein